MKFSNQLKINRYKILMILFTSCFLVSLVVILHIWKGVPIGHLTRDVTTIAEVPAYIGFFSQTGFLFWIATATLCLFSSLMKRTVYGAKHLKKFMFLAGLLTLLLCFDDMFLMHEQLFPSIGIPQKVVLITYGIITLLLLSNFYFVILKTDYILLVLALCFFGLSIFLDMFKIPQVNPYLLEDSSKMIGIISWFFYFYSNAMVITKDLTAQ